MTEPSKDMTDLEWAIAVARHYQKVQELRAESENNPIAAERAREAESIAEALEQGRYE